MKRSLVLYILRFFFIVPLLFSGCMDSSLPEPADLIEVLINDGLIGDDDPAGLGEAGIREATAADPTIEGDDDPGLIPDPGHLTLENGDIRVVIELSQGHVVGITDLAKGIDLLDPDADRSGITPFAVSLLEKFLEFGYRPKDYGPAENLILAGPPRVHLDEPPVPGKRRCRLGWLTTRGWTFEGIIEIPDSGAWVEFSGRAHAPGKMVYGFTYPILAGVVPLHDEGEEDRLAVPWESGIEVFDPIHAMRTLYSQGQAFFYRLHYPNGHQLMLPMIGYYSEPAGGGFLLHARDDRFTERFFSFALLDEGFEDGLPGFLFDARNWDVDGQAGSGLGRMVLPCGSRRLTTGTGPRPRGLTAGLPKGSPGRRSPSPRGARRRGAFSRRSR